MLYFMGDSTSTMQFGDQIACIDIQGTISSGGNITKLLDDYSRKKSIKAIILRINSPGGGVAPSQEIYREIERVRAKKPIIAFMGSVCRFGWILCRIRRDKDYGEPRNTHRQYRRYHGICKFRRTP